MGTDTSSVIPMPNAQYKKKQKALVKSLGSEFHTFKPIHVVHFAVAELSSFTSVCLNNVF
jgi:hypothetical protein